MEMKFGVERVDIGCQVQLSSAHGGQAAKQWGKLEVSILPSG